MQVPNPGTRGTHTLDDFLHRASRVAVVIADLRDCLDIEELDRARQTYDT